MLRSAGAMGTRWRSSVAAAPLCPRPPDARGSEHCVNPRQPPGHAALLPVGRHRQSPSGNPGPSGHRAGCVNPCSSASHPQTEKTCRRVFVASGPFDHCQAVGNLPCSVHRESLGSCPETVAAHHWCAGNWVMLRRSGQHCAESDSSAAGKV
ncbi:hypothetical protein D3C72_1255560 [compost metagenome]